MELSIIIVNYNTINYLFECLLSLQNVNKNKVEVFVVDNASTDGSPEMVKEKYPWVKLINNEKNLGFAVANNQAIIQSYGSYIMLLNSDTVVLEGTIDRILSFMNQNPDVGIVGCRLLNTDSSLQPSITSFPTPLKDAIAIALKGSILSNTPKTRAVLSRLGSVFGLSASRFDDHSLTKEIGFPRGACFTVRRQLIDEIGLLDENYFFTGEEMDFAYRAKQHGWKVYYYHEAAVIHHDHGATRQIMGKVLVQTRKSTLRFYHKHYKRSSTELMKLLLAVVLLFKCFIISFCLLFNLSNHRELLARREIYWAIIRMHYDSKFRELNVFSEMPFHYN